jgi:hypothetical protein
MSLFIVSTSAWTIGGEALPIVAHTGDPEAMTNLVDKVIDVMGGVDILVNIDTLHRSFTIL